MKKLLLLPLAIFLFSVSLSAQNPLIDCPAISSSVMGNTITVTLSNSPSSNNFNELFNVWDSRINGPDTTWNFEGYIIYQLDSCALSLPFGLFMQDTAHVRQVAQCDLANGITTLVHSDSLNCVPDTMVYGADAGIQHNFFFSTDAFTGQPFQTGQVYTYTAIAYVTNPWYMYSGPACTSPCTFLIGHHQNYTCALITGINEHVSEVSQLHVFPSPANNLLSVDLLDVQSSVKLLVYDISGQQVKALNTSGGSVYELDLTGLSPGTYFLETISAEKVFNSRFIKQ